MPDYSLTPNELEIVEERLERLRGGNLAYSNDREPITHEVIMTEKKTYYNKPSVETPPDGKTAGETLEELRQANESTPPPVQLIKEDAIREINSIIRTLRFYPKDDDCILAIGKLLGAVKLLTPKQEN